MSTKRLLGVFYQIGRKNNWRTIHTTNNLPAFHEYDKRSYYPHISDYKEEPKTVLERLKQGYSQFKEEMGVLKDEMIEKFQMDPIVSYRQGEVDVHWTFKGDPKKLEQFVVTCDSDFNEGYSKAT